MKANIKKVDRRPLKWLGGFTIIEVVLVLAIAGLIFMMVFVALPALQKSQRDTARKSDVSAVASLVESYSSNNRGSLPVTADYTVLASGAVNAYPGFGAYLDEILVKNSVQVIEPASGTISLPSISGEVPLDRIFVITHSECSSTPEVPTYTTSARKFSVITKLETGGGAYYCLNG